MDNSENKSHFVRALIVILSLMLVGMITFNFYLTEPKGEINSGAITLILILVVLVLSESFDNFSVGKLLSISREAKKKGTEVKELEQKNSSLLNQLLSITNSQTQQQNHTNVYGDYHGSSSQQKAKSQKINTEIDENDVTELLSRIGESIVIGDYEKLIIKDLENKNLDRDSVTSKVLIKHLAGTQISLYFEILNQDIFSSQIELLRALNESKPDGNSDAYIEGYVSDIIARNSEILGSWTTPDYLKFLYQKELIIQKNDHVRITNYGVEFLAWLVKSGRSRKNNL
jgi:hypothetical protein